MAVLLEEADGLSERGRARLMRALTQRELAFWTRDWGEWAHDGQAAPAGEWRTWVIMAGRGFGKTRAGAEWISGLAGRAREPVRIALVAATTDEARAVMVEGPSGLLAVGDPRARPVWEPSLKRLRWPGGSEAFLYSGASPERLRGPEHHFAWCDELAKWRHARRTWDMLQLGLRLGEAPRALVATTPQSGPALAQILEEPGTVRTGGATWANPHLPDRFVEGMEALYGGTRLGRQELKGELLRDVPGALWTAEGIEGARVAGFREEGPPLTPPGNPGGEHAAFYDSPPRLRGGVGGGSSYPSYSSSFTRVVIGVDPPASAEGTCGIVVCGLGRDGVGHVLADHSASGLSPEGWAAKVAAAAEAWDADRVVAEANQGGAMVKSVLRAADARLPVSLVHAARGKAARAEPVALLFENGRAKFAGRFPELEAELQGLVIGGGYDPGSWSGTGGPGVSPDRADAMVWALTKLMLESEREPRVMRL